MAQNLEPDAIGELHVPVLLDDVLNLLAPAFTGRETAWMVDATLGMGGHTEAVLETFPNVHVIGIDRDPQAIELASTRLARFSDRFQAVQETYDHIDEVVAGQGLSNVDAILMDLGVSSLQLDDDERGFSYSRPAPLDMRMNQSAGITAAEISPSGMKLNCSHPACTAKNGSRGSPPASWARKTAPIRIQ